MGKASRNKLLKVDYHPGQQVKVMLGRDWFDAQVVKSNKKTVVVVTLFSKTKYRKISSDDEGGLGTVLEPYTVKGSKTVKLPRIRVRPIEPELENVAKCILRTDSREPKPPTTPAPQETVEEASAPEPEYEGPGLGKDEAPLLDYESGPASEIGMAAEQAEAMLEERADQITEDSIDEPKPETAADVLAELEKMLE